MRLIPTLTLQFEEVNKMAKHFAKKSIWAVAAAMVVIGTAYGVKTACAADGKSNCATACSSYNSE